MASRASIPTFFTIPEEIRMKIVIEFWLNKYEDNKKQIRLLTRKHESLSMFFSSNGARIIRISGIKIDMDYHLHNSIMENKKTYSNVYDQIQSQLDEIKSQSTNASIEMMHIMNEIGWLKTKSIQIKIRIENLALDSGDYLSIVKRIIELNIKHFNECLL
uniref:Uncharacterized protein n=1 Tax=viral metagenome TaxID=1070528 RepID=A0A6C0BD30_9ZZZZ